MCFLSGSAPQFFSLRTCHSCFHQSRPTRHVRVNSLSIPAKLMYTSRVDLRSINIQDRSRICAWIVRNLSLDTHMHLTWKHGSVSGSKNEETKNVDELSWFVNLYLTNSVAMWIKASRKWGQLLHEERCFRGGLQQVSVSVASVSDRSSMDMGLNKDSRVVKQWLCGKMQNWGAKYPC